MMTDQLTPTRNLMLGEAGEAPAAVARQLTENDALYRRIGERLRALDPRLVVTYGRGSSDHAATYGRYLIEAHTGVPTVSAALSLASLYDVKPRLDRAACIAISQSGKSPDLIASVQSARAAGAYVVALVNDERSPLAGMADDVVPLRAGPELSVAATKSYIGTLTALASLVAAWTGDAPLARGLRQAPELLARAWALDWSALAELLRDRANLYTIGRGPGLGIAQEAALKLKETCGLHAEAFSAAEVRHGPMAIIGSGFPLLVFRQRDEAAAGIDELAETLAGRGADVAVAGAAPTGGIALPVLAAHPAIEPILQVQSFYRAANRLSLARGLDPDRPPHLAKVTETL